MWSLRITVGLPLPTHFGGRPSVWVSQGETDRSYFLIMGTGQQRWETETREAPASCAPCFPCSFLPSPHQAPHPFPLKLWVLVLPFLPLGIPTLPHSHPTQLKYILFVSKAGLDQAANRMPFSLLLCSCFYPSI